jgi:hypothetical protein
MITQPVPQSKPIDENGNWTTEWQQYWDTKSKNEQVSLSEEGFLVPTQTPANITALAPVSPSGILLFDATVINGGSSSNPNGQLYIRLNDGTFHPVTNT